VETPPVLFLYPCNKSFIFEHFSALWHNRFQVNLYFHDCTRNLSFSLRSTGQLVDFFVVVVFFSTGVWSQGLILARQALYHLIHSSSSFFCVGYFQDRVSRNTCPGWQTLILLISASRVARTTGMSHWHLVNWLAFWGGSEIVLSNNNLDTRYAYYYWGVISHCFPSRQSFKIPIIPIVYLCLYSINSILKYT
jgi:hypothetical protein